MTQGQEVSPCEQASEKKRMHIDADANVYLSMSQMSEIDVQERDIYIYTHIRKE